MEFINKEISTKELKNKSYSIQREIEKNRKHIKFLNYMYFFVLTVIILFLGDFLTFSYKIISLCILAITYYLTVGILRKSVIKNELKIKEIEFELKSRKAFSLFKKDND